MQRVKREHYVAQSHLRRFCKDNERLFVFDKVTRKSFGPTSVKNVAQECGFYDLPSDFVAKIRPEQKADSQFVEKLLANVDGFAKNLLDEILADVERRGITVEQRRFLALVIVNQLSRTRLNRQLVQEIIEKSTQSVLNKVVEQKIPNFREYCGINVEYPEYHLLAHQVAQMFDEDHVSKLATILNQHIWIAGVNRTIQPLYTSDHPVVKQANIHQPGRSFNGLRSPGVEILFPLSSRYGLIMLERGHFRKFQKFDGQARPMDPFEVERFNSLQVRKSYRWVFCEVDEFEQAIGVCRKHPEACDPNRPRVEVVESGDSLGFLFDD